MPQTATVRPLVVISVMASMAMVAIEATIVSTAMPQIASELGGLNLYSWVFSSFLLTQTALTVVFGKLADLFGRKLAILPGIAVFVLGSVLAGFSWSMPAMIVFRLIQGIGAGAILPVTLTIIGDLYPPRERGKVQGYLASVWAVCAVLGPTAGGLLIRELSWGWIFWINVPIGLLASMGFVFFYHEEKPAGRPRIDLAGAALFTIAVAALMMLLTDAGSASGARLGVELATLLISGILFFLQERRAVDPMISMHLWAHRPVAVCNAATVLTGMSLMGLTTFLPMYVQGVMHRTPVQAGLTLTMMMVGWPSGATIASRTFHRIGLRRILVCGSLFVPAGAVPFVLMTAESSALFAAIGSAVMGFGMGVLSVSCMVLIQEIVPPAQRGSATASNLFSRNLGNTLGAAVFGAIVNYGLAHANDAPPVTSEELGRLLASQAENFAASDALRFALHHSLHVMFLCMFAISVCAFLAMLCVPSIDITKMSKVRETAEL